MGGKKKNIKKIPRETMDAFSECIFNYDPEDLSLEYYDKREELEQTYAKCMANLFFQEKYRLQIDHFLKLRSAYRQNKTDIEDLKQLFDSFDNCQDDILLSRLISEISGRLEGVKNVVRSILSEPIEKFINECSLRDHNIHAITEHLSKETSDILEDFYNSLRKQEVLFKSRIKKENIDDKLKKIFECFEGVSPGLILAIVTCYHLNDVQFNLQNIHVTEFDYSVIMMSFHKAVEKAINAVMILSVKKNEDLIAAIPGTNNKKRFYVNGTTTWNGISIRDKISFITDDSIKRSRRMSGVEVKHIEQYSELLEKWQQTRNRHMHFETISNQHSIKKYFAENIKVLYTLVELVLILGVS